MKKIALCFMLFACNYTMAQKITVEADKRLKADFSKYKTFYWASQVDNELDPGFYFLNDLKLKANARQAIEAELLGLGYEKARSSPDMIVNFRVFEKPVTIKGFEGMGNTYWGANEVRDPDSRTEYDVKAGTLMVNLVDAKSGQVVWQGFASGLIDGDKFKKDEGKIREAANLLFDEYGQRAKEYSKK